MSSYFFMMAIAVVLIVLGALNMKGNISSLHSYHRHRVSEADRLPFGRMVGLGTIILGVSVVIYSVCQIISEKLSYGIFAPIGTVLLVLGVVVGLGLNFYAMIKYNKGIF